MEFDVLAAHNVRVVGSGEQYLVLGNGFGCDQSVWDTFIPLFEADFRIVTYDLMGSGATNPKNYNQGRYSTLHGFADDLLAILEELEVESCIYIGHSVSGMVGCLASLEKPSFFSKLFLLCASPRYVNDASSNYVGGFEPKELDGLFENMQSNFREWGDKFASLVLGMGTGSKLVQDFARALSAMRPEIAEQVLKRIFFSDYRSLLPRVTVDCRIIQTETDFVVPVAVADYLRQMLGGKGHLEILPMEGHYPQVNGTESLAAALRRQLQISGSPNPDVTDV